MQFKIHFERYGETDYYDINAIECYNGEVYFFDANEWEAILQSYNTIKGEWG